MATPEKILETIRAAIRAEWPDAVETIGMHADSVMERSDGRIIVHTENGDAVSFLFCEYENPEGLDNSCRLSEIVSAALGAPDAFFEHENSACMVLCCI